MRSNAKNQEADQAAPKPGQTQDLPQEIRAIFYREITNQIS